jgi:UDP-glucose 4-epimerase
MARVTSLDIDLPFSSVLVTGGAGFIGSHLVDALLALWRAGRAPEALRLRVVDNLSSGHLCNLAGALAIRRADGTPVVELFTQSVLDPLDTPMEGIEAVFHLAAHVFPARSVEAPREDAEINIAGTLNVLEAARRAGVQRVVYASTAAVYGDPRELPITEDTPALPLSPYGVSKLSAEQYCRLYSSLYALPVTVLRFFNVYGPRQSSGSAYAGVIPRFVERARRGLPLLIYGDGSQTRDFVHVDDVVQACLLAVQTDHVGTYNIATGHATSVAELAALLAALVAEATGLPPAPVEHGPPRPGDILHSVASTELVSQKLGFHARVTLTQGIRGLLAATLKRKYDHVGGPSVSETHVTLLQSKSADHDG